jgi:hypothetical protein
MSPGDDRPVGIVQSVAVQLPWTRGDTPVSVLDHGGGLSMQCLHLAESHD